MTEAQPGDRSPSLVDVVDTQAALVVNTDTDFETESNGSDGAAPSIPLRGISAPALSIPVRGVSPFVPNSSKPLHSFTQLIALLTKEHDHQLSTINDLKSEIRSMRRLASARPITIPSTRAADDADDDDLLSPLPGVPSAAEKSVAGTMKPPETAPPSKPSMTDPSKVRPKPETSNAPFAQRKAWQGQPDKQATSHGVTEIATGKLPDVSQDKQLNASDSDLRGTAAPAVAPKSLLRGFPWCFGHGRMSVKDALSKGDVQLHRDSDWVINPEQSTHLMKWDQVTIVSLCFVAVVTPVEVGMMETKFDALFVINRAIDLVFLADMILQFFLMYPVKTNFGVMMEGNHKKIIKRYLKGWFTIDFLSILQFDLIGLVMQSEAMQKAKVIKVIRLLRLLKLVKVSIVARIFHRIEVRTSIAYQRVALYKFLVLLLFITHWLASLWAMTLTFVDEEPDVIRWISSIDDLDPTGKTRTVDDLPALYLASIYFTSYTITSVGYGDIGPKNVVERIVCTLMIFVSGIVWAYVLGQVCGIIGSMGILEQDFRKSMDDLNFMMMDRELPQDMRRRLRSFFLSTKDLQRMNQESALLHKMSPALQGEVAITTNWEWLRKVPFMTPLLDAAKVAKTADERAPTYIVDIAIALESSIYAQSELFGKPKTLYILQKGLTSRRLRVLRSGSVWGEDFVLSNPKLVQTATCHALTYVQVSHLHRDAFFRIVHRHRKSYPVLEQAVRRCIARLTFARGFILKAREEQLARGMTPVDCVGRHLNFDASDSDEE